MVDMIFAEILSLIIFYVAAVFWGEFVVIPVLYFAALGNFGLPSVFVVSALAMITYDHIWYLIGRFVPRNKLLEISFVKRLRPTMDRLYIFFERHGEVCVFYSKFVFGTRTATMLLSGLNDMSILKFSRTNILATFLWTVLLTAFAMFVNSSISSLVSSIFYLRIGVLVFIAVVLIFGFLTRRYLKYKVMINVDNKEHL